MKEKPVKQKLKRLFFFLCLLLLSACQQITPSSVVPTASPNPTKTFAATFTPTPHSTAMVTASSTPHPTATLLPSGTPTLQPTSITQNAFAVGFSADGRILAFNSSIPALTPGDQNPATEAHLYQMESGAVQAVWGQAPDPAGQPIASWASSMSANGRYLLHGGRSNAPEPASEHYNFVLLRDIATGQDRCIDFTPLEQQFGASSSIQAVLSPDGQMLALEVAAESWNIYLFNPVSGQLTPVSVPPGGEFENGNSYEPVFSPDGRYLAFASDSSNLIAGDEPCSEQNPACGDVFVYEIPSGKLERIPARLQFTMGNPYPNLTVSNNARSLAWTELEDVETQFRPVNRLFDRQTRKMETICADVDGYCSGHSPSISSNGRWLAFSAFAGLDAAGHNKTGAYAQVYLLDHQTGKLALISANEQSVPGNGASGVISLQQEGFSSDVRISGDGRFVAFSSQAANLLPPGTEKRQCYDPIIVGPYPCYDLFLYDRQASRLAWVDQPTAGLALPVLEHPALPTAVLVFQNASKQLALFDRKGQILQTMNKMGIDPVGFNPDDYQVIGPISPVEQTVPLALLSLYNFGQVQVWEHQQYTKKIPAPDIVSLKSAPGQPVIAYSAFHPSTGETARSEVFLLPVDNPPADPSPLIQAVLPGSYGLYPVAVHARGSTPLGVWLTQQINGIGGWNFDVDRGLAYVDAAT